MDDTFRRVKELFLAALEKEGPEERAAFLSEACGADEGLRRRVETLLDKHEEAGGFLGPPAAGPLPTERPRPGQFLRQSEVDRATAPAEAVGGHVGPYKLLQKLGEGGMGVVWVAEQQEPVKRRVALKVVKPGMDSAQVLRRFEAERQALALMDHTNIAKVLDAGATAEGRPYFVMELVQGVPLTRYCDELHLSVRERLELFVAVCQAIQHAHQKGVIHRDIKPSNVLVCMQDGKPVPKVIDFGVAKALHQPLTERSLYTEVGAVVGTLEYMSPEQAEMSPLGVDTRADVYSLGVLLYELLTGSTPLDRKRLKQAAYTEMVRLIREEEPPKPSTRLTQSKESLASLAAQRRTEPAKLAKAVRGELDWIVMKALEKDRTRRYATANGLARDVERHLHDEPVEACPPGALYRLRKFVRRHRGPVLAAAVVALALLGSTCAATWGLLRAERARAEAERARQAEAEQRQLAEENERKAREAAAAEGRAKESAQARLAETRAVLEFVEEKVFAAARPEGQEGGLGREATMRQALEAALPAVEGAFRGRPLVEASLRQTLGTSFLCLGEAQIAAEQYQAARALFARHLGPDHPDTLGSMNNLANSYAALGRRAEALSLREQVAALRKEKLGPGHPDTLAGLSNLANSYAAAGRLPDACKLHEQVLALRRERLGPGHADTLASMNNLANSYAAVGRQEEALRLREQTLGLRKKELGPTHPDTLASMHNLANSYHALGRLAEARKLFQETLALRREKLGPGHPDTLTTLGNLAASYFALAQYAEARKLFAETVALQKEKLGAGHPDTLTSMGNLAASYVALGRHAEALQLHEQVLARRKARLGPAHPDTLRSLWAVAEGLVALGRGAEAVPLIDECVRRAAGRAVEPGLVSGLVGLRLRHFAKAKDAAGCRATAEMWEGLERTDAASLYNAACFRAVTAAVLRAAAKPAEADAEAGRAMAWLRQAVAAGYKDAAHLREDGDLDALRGRDDFRKLLAGLEAGAGEDRK